MSVRAEEPPLAPSEEREVWGYLEELVIVRQERDSLRQALGKSTETDQVLRAQIAKLTELDSLNEKIIAQYGRLDEVRVKEVDTYKRIAAAEQKNAADEKDRRERTEKVSLVLLIVEAIGFGLLAAFGH